MKHRKVLSVALLALVAGTATGFATPSAASSAAWAGIDVPAPKVQQAGDWPEPRVDSGTVASRLDKPTAAPAQTVASARRAVTGAYATAVVADAPIAYWRLDELSGTTAADSSGKGRTATYAGVSGYQRPGALIGDTNTAISAANNSVLSVASTGLPAASTARTVEFWSQVPGCCGTSAIRYGDLANGAGFEVSYAYDSNRLTIGDGIASHQVSVPQPFGANDGNWHLFDFVYSAGRVTFYLDGVSLANVPFGGLNTVLNGGLVAGSGGSLDEIALYATALTSTRVAAHWTSGSSSAAACATTPTGRYPGVVLADTPSAYYRADDIVTTPKGRVLYDDSGNCRNGSLRYTDTSSTGALVGDGNTGVAGAVDAGAGSLPAGNTARSVEFWAGSPGCCGTLGVGYGNSGAGDGFSLTYGYDNGRLTVATGTSATTISVNQPFGLNDTRWHLFDVTYSAGVVIVYVDGVAAGRAPIGTLSTDVSVGLTASAPFLDEIAVYPSALSAARISAHWTAGSSGAAACSPTPTARYPKVVLADRPASYYRAGDIATSAKGRVSFDSSGNCANGSFRYTDRSATGAVIGDPNAATSGSFTAPAAALPAGDTARTVEFWLATPGCCGTSGVSYGDLTRANGFSLTYTFDSGIITMGDGGSDLSSITIASPYALNDGRYHLFDITYNGTTVIVYVDGVAVGSGQIADLTTDPSIGLTASGRSVDEVAVYPTALSAQRISAHWTAGSTASAACATTPTGTYPAAVLADTPASYYRLGDIALNSKGRVAYDSSGHCYNGALRYTDTTTPGALLNDEDGATSGQFTGNGASLPAGASARTVEFWIASPGCCGVSGVRYGNFAEGNGFAVEYTYDSNRLTVSDGSSSTAQLTVISPKALNDGSWHLVDLVFTGTKATFYIDGVAAGGGALGGWTTDTTLGLNGNSPSLDEVAIYSTALTAARVAAHWTASGRA